MRRVTIGLALAAILGIALVGVWRLVLPRKSAAVRPIYNTSLCAFNEPIADTTQGFCDKAEGLERPPAVSGCELTKEVRVHYRTRVRDLVRGMQLAWAGRLLALHIIERLETGEIEFTPELGQRIFGAMYGATKLGAIPKAPTERLAFIEALKCSPREWANSRLKGLNDLDDNALAKLFVGLPDGGSLPLEVDNALAFLPADE